ncbi:hypothetical protein ACMU_08145 [Actibacterium mucosum KCTC 23349]|uniref:NAD-dependent epimerase/dehydratase domain-containing protein n=1 Tax=Actibacterium mucosum KCTC 23349 TaxID=1454373 RepID=A0A037ZN02_9RHOB|nr:NAD(P)-dependent oxidoreductase [Actibacterium mucosum]KAJ56898.1 hypothetical protein ACMU_08145 [Actibacterium mucosum KCTC 23349]
MRVAVTGGTGLVGRFFVERALAQGHEVTVLSRTKPTAGFFSAQVHWQAFTLGDHPSLNVNEVIHCAFAHVPGRYRGGEGDDPTGFIRANLDGSLAIFNAARKSGVKRVVFLSSRAVYGVPQDGGPITEESVPAPNTLYGTVKLAAEKALAEMSGPAFIGQSLRATGVYGPAGPGQYHKWAELLANYLAGKPVEPRQGTEVHGADLAHAAGVLFDHPSGAYNVSDILLDRNEMLRIVGQITGCAHTLPEKTAAPFDQMDTGKLRHAGWTPGGWPLLRQTLQNMLMGAD